MNDDCQLIQATLAGDNQAFGELVTRYQDRLYSALVYILGCPVEAQDAAQDAFLQAYRCLDQFQGRSAFYSWLYRIALNQCASRRRRRRPTVSFPPDRPGGLEPEDPGDRPDQQLQRAEQVDVVQRAIQALNEEHRTILILREMEQCDYEQIAEILGVPVGTVRSRLHRARLQLREQLKEWMPQEITRH